METTMKSLAEAILSEAAPESAQEFEDEYTREGTFWKYPNRRSDRSVLLDAGHLNQTIYLSATAAGMGVGTTAAQCDEIWEREMGLTAATHVIALVTGLGHPRTDDPYRTARPEYGEEQ